MRILSASAALAVCVLLFDIPLHAADASVSGKLVFENGDFSCDRCVVTLLDLGARPIASTFADLGGNFMFRNVPRGNFSIHVEIDEFEAVDQPIEVNGIVNSVLVSVARKRSAESAPGVVNVSEFNDRYPKKAISFFQKGTAARKKKNNDEAIKNLQRAVEIAPAFYQAHLELGVAYLEGKRIEDSEREFLKAHELNSTAVEPLLNLTTVYLDENKPDRAVDTGEQAVKANSKSAPAFFGLGMALYKAALLDRAERALTQALELAPKMGDARLLLANVYLKLHRYDNTLEQLNRYIAENPHGRQLRAVQDMREQLLQTVDTGRP